MFFAQSEQSILRCPVVEIFVDGWIAFTFIVVAFNLGNQKRHDERQILVVSVKLPLRAVDRPNAIRVLVGVNAKAEKLLVRRAFFHGVVAHFIPFYFPFIVSGLPFK